MADSQESFSQESVSDLDIVTVYKELMAASTEQGSVYIKAKETLDALLKDNSIVGTDAANAIAQTITGIATSLTAAAMNAAIDIAKDERNAPYELAKLKEETILLQEQQNKIATDIENGDADKSNKVMAGWKMQGELYRDYGINAYNLLTTAEIVAQSNYTDSGLKYEANRKAKADIHIAYTSGYNANGYVAYNVDDTGKFTSAPVGDGAGLAPAQTAVAIRQKAGFDDNKRQHVANSSASMMSMLLSTEASGIDYTSYLAKWSNSIDYLNVNYGATAGTITNDTVPASISIVAGETLTGTTVNITAGSSVSVHITDGTLFSATVVGIVQLDGTWDAIFLPADLDNLATGANNIVASVMDSVGGTRLDTDTVTVVA